MFQPQYSCGPPLSRELTREKNERLFVALTPGEKRLFPVAACDGGSFELGEFPVLATIHPKPFPFPRSSRRETPSAPWAPSRRCAVSGAADRLPF